MSLNAGKAAHNDHVSGPTARPNRDLDLVRSLAGATQRAKWRIGMHLVDQLTSAESEARRTRSYRHGAHSGTDAAGGTPRRLADQRLHVIGLRALPRCWSAQVRRGVEGRGA